MRKLFVCSKELPTDKGLGNQSRLIGVLTELKPGGNKPEQYGEYQFEYKLGGRFPEWFLQIECFPDSNKIYTNEDPGMVRFFKKFLPPANYKYLQEWLDDIGLKEYDEWALLENKGINKHETACLYSVLPENIIIYG